MARSYRKPPGSQQDTRKGRGPVVVPIRGADGGRKAVPPLPIPKSKALAVTRRTWEEFWQSDLSQIVDLTTDAHGLLRWITYVDEWHRALRIYRAQRMTEGSRKQLRTSPAFTTLSQIEAHLHAAEQELGLTPLARSRLGIKFGRAQITAAELNQLAERRQGELEDAGEFSDWREPDT